MATRALAWLVAHEVPSFWVAQALALGVATWLASRRAARATSRGALGAALGFALGASLGASLMGPLLRLPSALSGGPAPFSPGFVMSWGALLGASLGVALVARAGEVRLALDAAAPALGVLVAGGRLGCLVAGCCHGKPSAWGLAYPPGTPAFDEHVRRGLVGARAPSSLATWPAPAFEALVGAALVCVGLRARRGGAFALVLGGYALARLGLEALRDDPRPRLGPLTLAQWLALAVLAGLVATSWPHDDAPRAP